MGRSSDRPAAGSRRTAAGPERSGRMLVAAVLVGLVAVAGGLAGCSTTGTSSGGATQGAAPAPQAPDDATAGRDTDSGAEVAGAGSPAGGTLVDADRDLIVTATTTVRTPDVLAATDRVLALARRFQAIVADQSTSTGEDPGPLPVPCPQGATDCARPATGYASSTLTLRVLPDQVDALLTEVNRLGEPVSVTRSVADVTTEVADVQSRVRSAQASLARIRALMSRAQSISDLVALEAELSTRQADLESLQAQQRALADRTARATVTVVLVAPDAPVVTPPDDRGFLAGLSRGWAAFTDAAVVGLTVLGAVLPFLAAGAVLALAVLLVVRVSHRRRSVRAPEPPPA